MNAPFVRTIVPRGPRGVRGPINEPTLDGASVQWQDADGNLLPPVSYLGPEGPAGDAQFLNSRNIAELTTISAGVDTITLRGELAPGDRVPFSFRRVVSEPAHSLKVQTADGAWWEEIANADVIGGGFHRAAPAFAAGRLPTKVVSVTTPGRVVMTEPLRSAALRWQRPRTTQMEVFVERWGDDGTGAVDDPALPFATIQEAVSNTDASFITVGPGVFAPFTYANSDDGWSSTAGGFNSNFKIIRAREPMQTIIQIVGPTLHTQTWVDSGGGIYSTVLAGTAVPERVLRRDGFDEFGFETQFRRYSPAASPEGYASVPAALTALAAGGTGWVFDSGTRTLYIRWGGSNVESLKFSLRALYSDTGVPQSVNAVGAAMMIDGLVLDGVPILLQEGGSFVPEIWISDCVSQFSTIHSASDVPTGAGMTSLNAKVYSENFRVHSPADDGMQYFGGAGFNGFSVEINGHYTDAGAIDTFGATDATGAARTPNKQGSTMHHGTSGCRFGVISETSYGANISDISGPAGSATSTWQIGVLTRRSEASSNPAGQTFTRDVSEPMRSVWLDSCLDLDEQTSIRNLAFNGCTVFAAVLKDKNPTNYFPVLAAGVGETIAEYDPRSP